MEKAKGKREGSQRENKQVKKGSEDERKGGVEEEKWRRKEREMEMEVKMKMK